MESLIHLKLDLFDFTHYAAFLATFLLALLIRENGPMLGIVI